VGSPMFTALLPVSAPFEVVRPQRPLVSKLGQRTTVKDGTTDERGLLGHSALSRETGSLNGLPVETLGARHGLAMLKY
jgi:hypothetical protein